MNFGTGHIADHPEVVKRRPGLHLHAQFAGRMMATALPLATTNRAKLPPAEGGPGVLNQEDLGACEGFAHGAAATLLLALQGLSKGLISPIALWLGALMCDATIMSDGKLSPITNTGTMPSSILTAWQIFGARLAAQDAQYPVNDATIFVRPGDPSSPLILPNLDDLYADSPFRYGGAYFIQDGGDDKILAVMRALASGFPVSDAIPASGSQFQMYRSGVLGALDGPIDHANTILDFEWDGSNLSSVIFHCLNSWGDALWGEADPIAKTSGGLYRANRDYLNQAEDLCVLDLSLL